jgi:hypothetical protein
MDLRAGPDERPTVNPTTRHRALSDTSGAEAKVLPVNPIVASKMANKTLMESLFCIFVGFILSPSMVFIELAIALFSKHSFCLRERQPPSITSFYCSRVCWISKVTGRPDPRIHIMNQGRFPQRTALNQRSIDLGIHFVNRT